MDKPKRSHTSHPLKMRAEVLAKLEEGIKPKILCEQYGIKSSTLSTWKKFAPDIKKQVESGVKNDRKRNRASFMPQVERALLLWIQDLRSRPNPPPISHLMLGNKAEL